MDRDKTKLKKEDESTAFTDFESADESAEGMELDSYNSDSDFADGFEKIHEQTELYKKLNPLLDEDEEDEDFYEAEMVTLEEDSSGEEDEDWNPETVEVKSRSESILFAHDDETDKDYAIRTVSTEYSLPSSKAKSDATLLAARKKAGKKVVEKKAKKKAAKKTATKKTTTKKKTAKKSSKKKTATKKAGKKSAKKKLGKKKVSKSPAKKKKAKKKK
jgi:hypothetical protein